MTLIRRTLLKYAVGSTALTFLPKLAHSSGDKPNGAAGSVLKKYKKLYHDVDAGLVLAQQYSIVAGWNQTLLNAVNKGFYPPTIGARTLAILNAALFNVWQYLEHPHAKRFAVFSTAISRDQGRDVQFQRLAISAAAATVLKTLFPASVDEITSYSVKLGLDSRHPYAHLAIRVGEEGAQSMLKERARDGSNQLGDMNPGPYSDYTGYSPVNSPSQMVDPDHWQPLQFQSFLTPQWAKVRPFGLKSPSQFRPSAPPSVFTPEMHEQMQEVVDLNANLTPEQMIECQYWADGSRLPWVQFAQLISYHQRHSLAQDVRMFRAVSFALHDAMVATWDAKLAYDSPRPLSAIRAVFGNRILKNWVGVKTGVIEVPGTQWAPYLSTPPFPEYVSAHSTAGHAAAAVLERFAHGHFRIKQQVSSTSTLYWDSFQAAAVQAGYSRRLGGIHFKSGDLLGRELGKRIGKNIVTLFA
jgi:hypothetical protein